MTFSRLSGSATDEGLGDLIDEFVNDRYSFTCTPSPFGDGEERIATPPLRWKNTVTMASGSRPSREHDRTPSLTVFGIWRMSSLILSDLMSLRALRPEPSTRAIHV